VVDACEPSASISFGKLIDQPTTNLLTVLPLWRWLSTKIQESELMGAIFTSNK